MSENLDVAFFDFFASLPQQGPGSDAETLAVLSRVVDCLPRAPVVAEFGCGTGRATLAIAERMQEATITAVDLAEVFCRRLRGEVARRGLADRIHVERADMSSPPIAANSLDLVWSEGAAYNIGFAKALTCWRPLLKADGFCVVSECEWLRRNPPESVERFWAEAYPSMRDREANAALARAADYDVLDTVVLSNAAWDDYYGPISDAIRDGRAAHLGSDVLHGLAQERHIFEQSDGSYGYVFYILRPQA